MFSFLKRKFSMFYIQKSSSIGRLGKVVVVDLPKCNNQEEITVLL
jgi:hypothetical protein